MPEALFKAKRIDNGEWAEGSLILVTGICAKILYNVDEWAEIVFYTTNDKGFVTTHRYAVIPETICQYTGQNDRKGTKIFKSDRFRFFDEEGTSDYIVKWDNYECCYIIEDERGCTDSFNGFIAAYCEVLGNVHDSPKDARKGGETE